MRNWDRMARRAAPEAVPAPVERAAGNDDEVQFVHGARLLRLRFEDAVLSLADIGHINAHGTSTPLNDQAEANAITALFGPTSPPVTSAKGVTGHSLGAAGALEAVASVMTIDQEIIPPTIGTSEVDPKITIDVVYGAPRKLEKPVVLSNSFGFGGHNGCLVIGRRS